MGARRFKHFQENLGIAKNTLTSRLNDLIEGGIIKKVPADDGSAYDEYRLTDRGRDLSPVIIALAQWGDKWVAHDQGPSTVITDKETGDRLPRIWPRREAGEIVELHQIGMRRANGAPPKVWHQEKEDQS